MDHELCSKKTIGIRSAAPMPHQNVDQVTQESCVEPEPCSGLALPPKLGGTGRWTSWMIGKTLVLVILVAGILLMQLLRKVEGWYLEIIGNPFPGFRLWFLKNACLGESVALGHELGLFDMVKQIFTATNR